MNLIIEIVQKHTTEYKNMNLKKIQKTSILAESLVYEVVKKTKIIELLTYKT